jgi:nicotinate phosphoribosyltransferase
MDFSCTIEAIQEGEVVFANTPLVRVEGPIIQCQLLETAMLQIVNFETLIATKASRIVDSADGDAVVEFGYRRAQNPLLASRASYIGGCSATSNVEAGKMFGIPIKGTHAHSWVMSFDEEIEAFRSYAKSMPNNCIFLVDTYDTIKGIRKAIVVGLEMKAKGHNMIGIRLDSGDMVDLSIKAREMLDTAGFKDTVIVASNDLDEYTVTQMKADGAKINVWGIGTKLVTAFDQPALGGVYKLAAIENDQGNYDYKMKLGSKTKESFPGKIQVRRFSKELDGQHIGDFIYDELSDKDNFEFINPRTNEKMDLDGEEYLYEDLLTMVYSKGVYVGRKYDIRMIRHRSWRRKAEFDFSDRLYDDGKTFMEEGYQYMRNELKMQHKR